MSTFSSKPKTTLELTAQIVTFASQTIPNFNDCKYVMDQASALAEQGMTDLTRVVMRSEYREEFKTKDNKSGSVPAGTIIPVARTEDYRQFLKNVGGTHYCEIAERIIILNAYQDFKPLVEELKLELLQLESTTEHPTFLGKGSNAKVFAITHNGERYAVRIPNGGKVNVSVVDFHISGACLSLDLPQMEKIVAASYDDGVTVAKLMSGKEIGKLTIEDVRSITNQQLLDLLETVIEANRRGIEIDPKPSNFFYDREEGFGIVDFTSSKKLSKSSLDQPPQNVIWWLSTVIVNATFYGTPHKVEMTQRDYADQADRQLANHEVLIRLKDIIKCKLEKADYLGDVLQKFDETIANHELTIKNLTDLEWVNARIAEDQQRRVALEERDRTGLAIGVENSDLIV